MRVDFYHLTRSPIERVLPQIAEKVLADGGRLLVVADEEALRVRLDEALWSHAPESFVPHGRAGGEDDARQPVLIADTPHAVNDARYVALADGIWREEALGFERAFHFFDEEKIAAARLTWKALAEREEIERNYWKQNEAGRWERAA